MRTAADWLISIQNDDGGWGEDGESYARLPRPRPAPQTRVTDRLGVARPDGDRRRRPSGGRARDRVSRDQEPDGFWQEPRYTATGSRACSTCATTAIRCSSRLGAGPVSQLAARQHAAGGVRVLSRPGIVVGLQAEARIARRLGWPVAVGGGTASGAADAVQRLIASGATAVVSIGLAGGLDPALRPGAILGAEPGLARRRDCRNGSGPRRMVWRPTNICCWPAIASRRPRRPKPGCLPRQAPMRSISKPERRCSRPVPLGSHLRPCARSAIRPSGACRPPRWSPSMLAARSGLRRCCGRWRRSHAAAFRLTRARNGRMGRACGAAASHPGAPAGLTRLAERPLVAVC